MPYPKIVLKHLFIKIGHLLWNIFYMSNLFLISFYKDRAFDEVRRPWRG